MMRGAQTSGVAGGSGLVALLDEQVGLCRRLDDLGRRQEECIESSNTDGLLQVLGQRQGIVDRIAVVSVELEPLRSRREEVMAALPEPDRVRVRSLVADLQTLAERIQRRDEAGRNALAQQRTRLAEEIGEVTRARGAVAAYGQAYRASPGARMQDRQG